jgi:hypothetical protein
MNKLGVALGTVGVLAVLGVLTVTVGSGVVVTETLQVSGVQDIHLKGQGQIILRQGETKSLTIEAEDNVMPLIETVVRGDSLTLKFNTGLFRTVIPRKGIKYFLTLSNPRKVTISGSGSLVVNNISVDEFTTRINGSADGSIHNINADRMVSDINGSGKFRITGSVFEQTVEISGSGNYRAKDLISEIARVEISGSGRAEINARQELDVRISGSGEILYRGNPRISQRISGSGKIRKMS